MALDHVASREHGPSVLTCAEVDRCGFCGYSLPTMGGCACPSARESRMTERAPEQVDHPAHYGGADDPYEAIKVIEAWRLGFCLGNAVKYIARAERKGATITDLQKARWYIDREIQRREQA